MEWIDSVSEVKKKGNRCEQLWKKQSEIKGRNGEHEFDKMMEWTKIRSMEQI